MSREIPLNTLRAFEAVGRHCHVRRAADELHLTHAALSRKVRILEEQLGCTLFSRENKRMQLTSAGERFLAVVQDSLRSLEEAAIRLDPGSLAGALTIATTPTISTSWLPTILSEFSTRYSEVEIHCVTIDPFNALLPSQFDVALCLGEPEAKGKRVQKLFEERYFPVCSPSLLKPDTPIREPAELAMYPLLHEGFQHWVDWFALHGLATTKGASNLYFDYGFQAISAARHGLGIALADQLEIAGDLRQGSLVRPLDLALPVDAGVYLVTAQKEQQTIRTELFVEELIRSLARSQMLLL